MEKLARNWPLAVFILIILVAFWTFSTGPGAKPSFKRRPAPPGASRFLAQYPSSEPSSLNPAATPSSPPTANQTTIREDFKILVEQNPSFSYLLDNPTGDNVKLFISDSLQQTYNPAAQENVNIIAELLRIGDADITDTINKIISQTYPQLTAEQINSFLRDLLATYQPQPTTSETTETDGVKEETTAAKATEVAESAPTAPPAAEKSAFKRLTNAIRQEGIVRGVIRFVRETFFGDITKIKKSEYFLNAGVNSRLFLAQYPGMGSGSGASNTYQNRLAKSLLDAEAALWTIWNYVLDTLRKTLVVTGPGQSLPSENYFNAVLGVSLDNCIKNFVTVGRISAAVKEDQLTINQTTAWIVNTTLELMTNIIKSDKLTEPEKTERVKKIATEFCAFNNTTVNPMTYITKGDEKGTGEKFVTGLFTKYAPPEPPKEEPKKEEAAAAVAAAAPAVVEKTVEKKPEPAVPKLTAVGELVEYLKAGNVLCEKTENKSVAAAQEEVLMKLKDMGKPLQALTDALTKNPKAKGYYGKATTAAVNYLNQGLIYLAEQNKKTAEHEALAKQVKDKKAVGCFTINTWNGVLKLLIEKK